MHFLFKMSAGPRLNVETVSSGWTNRIVWLPNANVNQSPVTVVQTKVKGFWRYILCELQKQKVQQRACMLALYCTVSPDIRTIIAKYLQYTHTHFFYLNGKIVYNYVKLILRVCRFLYTYDDCLNSPQDFCGVFCGIWQLQAGI